MGRPNFDPDLFLSGTVTGTGPVGPFTATGPMPAGPPGNTARWVWVWVVQNLPSTAAAARGNAPGPFVGNWQVPLTSVAQPFVPNRRARGVAVALIEDGGGPREAYWWSEAIWIRP